MILQIKVIESKGFPEFRVVNHAIREPGDSVRLSNWTNTTENNFRFAFKAHSESTAKARTGEDTSGMQFGDLVHKMLGFPKCDTCDRMEQLKAAVEKVIPLLPENNDDVKSLKKYLKMIE